MATRFFPNYNKNKVTSPYGMRTMNGVTRMHQGIDLVAAEENGRSAVDQITAHTGGTVEAVGYSASAGYYINIRVDADTLMVYYHLKELPGLERGSAVSAGQVIGYMGSTGNSTGAHLHFGIQRNGAWIDPEPYLDKDYAPAPRQDPDETPTPRQDFSLGMRTLRKGDKGEDVRALQILLSGRGCNGKMHQPDGIFGPNTQGAVTAYQKKAFPDDASQWDGIAGPITWGSLLGVSV